MNENNIIIDFKYVDEFGQENRMVKTFNSCIFDDDDQTTFEFLVEEFKLFMTASGFCNVDSIQIVEND